MPNCLQPRHSSSKRKRNRKGNPNRSKGSPARKRKRRRKGDQDRRARATPPPVALGPKSVRRPPDNRSSNAGDLRTDSLFALSSDLAPDTAQSTVRAEADTAQSTVRAEADTVARLFRRAEETSARSDATGTPPPDAQPRLLWQEVLRSYNQLAGLGQGHDLRDMSRNSNTWMSFHDDEKILRELPVDGDNIMTVPPSSPTQFLLSMTKTNI